MTTHETGESSTPALVMPEITQDQLQQIIQSLREGTRKPKIKEPDTYRGERHKLREWLAQLQVYFKAIKWAKGHDDEQVLYAISLLRDDAGKWITPYTEELIPSTWENWAGFAQELRSLFGVIDAKGEARITLKNMKQGRRLITEYWNEFRLEASEMGLEDSTADEWLLGGINTELQNAWGLQATNARILQPSLTGQSRKKQNWPRYDASKEIRHRQLPQGQTRSQETSTGHINLEQQLKEWRRWT